jgi:hypothetical protein
MIISKLAGEDIEPPGQRQLPRVALKPARRDKPIEAVDNGWAQSNRPEIFARIVDAALSRSGADSALAFWSLLTIH